MSARDPAADAPAAGGEAASAGVDPPRLGIAIGDPNGIGPEIAIKAARAARGARPVLIGDAHVIEACAERLGIDADARARFEVIDVPALARAAWRPGEVSAAAGAATVAYVRAAVELHAHGALDAIAASPHSETAVNAAGIPFSGYSGLVADLTGTPRDRVFLMLAAPGLRVAHATLHERLVDAVARLTPRLVEQAALAAHEAVRRLGVPAPRIGLLGINPHAGEGGLFGDDDERVGRPAVERLRALGVDASGPLAADLALSERRLDAYVAMFHDQGHVAVKMLSPKGATAFVVGAPLLFASVAHGAAFDIAGRGAADESAMAQTLAMLSRASR